MRNKSNYFYLFGGNGDLRKTVSILGVKKSVWTQYRFFGVKGPDEKFIMRFCMVVGENRLAEGHSPVVVIVKTCSI